MYGPHKYNLEFGRVRRLNSKLAALINESTEEYSHFLPLCL